MVINAFTMFNVELNVNYFLNVNENENEFQLDSKN